jgi:hypothetical protein
MTTPSSPSDAIKGIRHLFVWALLGYVALFLAFEFLSWIVPSLGFTFTRRSYNADFVHLYTIVLPLLAVLIATQIQPVLSGTKLFATIALLEYVVALFFGAITFLIGLGYAFGGVDSAAGALSGLRYIVFELLELGIMVLAGYAVFRVFTSVGGSLSDLGATKRPPAHAAPEPPSS